MAFQVISGVCQLAGVAATVAGMALNAAQAAQIASNVALAAGAAGFAAQGAGAVADAVARARERGRTLQGQLARPIKLTDRVLKSCGEARSNRSECAEIARHVDTISEKLRGAARLTPSTSIPINDRQIRHLAAGVSKNLKRALTLVRKCKNTKTSAAADDFKKVSSLLESSIADLNWMLPS